MRLIRYAAAGLAVLLFTPVVSAGPVRRINIYVSPYYAAAKTPGSLPSVNVHPKVDRLLASRSREDIEKARDIIVESPELVSPMTLMVLAIRLYDTGARDQSVLWFYIAKDRFLTSSTALNFEHPSMSEAKSALLAFNELAGQYINSYAFCDIEKRRGIRQQALDWVIAHPYEIIHSPQVPKLSGDPEANLRKGVEKQKAAIQAETEYLANPDNLKDFMEKRAARNVEEQFCWKDS